MIIQQTNKLIFRHTSSMALEKAVLGVCWCQLNGWSSTILVQTEISQQLCMNYHNVFFFYRHSWYPEDESK